MKPQTEELDAPERVDEIRRIIRKKPALRRLYEESYGKYAACLARSPAGGAAIELGSGAGFAKTLIPELVTTDLIPYDNVDAVVDARRMPFADNSLRMIAMLNVFHHIPDVASFLEEVQRCLMPGGRLLLLDQHPGWLASPIYRHLHHEPFDPHAPMWQFASTGPLSGANGALSWIVFVRDRQKFQSMFPRLRLLRYQPTTPLRYWLAGGLKEWCLLPDAAWRFATMADRCLIKLHSGSGSFVDIELEKCTQPG